MLSRPNYITINFNQFLTNQNASDLNSLVCVCAILQSVTQSEINIAISFATQQISMNYFPVTWYFATFGVPCTDRQIKSTGKIKSSEVKLMPRSRITRLLSGFLNCNLNDDATCTNRFSREDYHAYLSWSFQ